VNPSPTATASPQPEPSGAPAAQDQKGSVGVSPNPDLSTDANGLSKATVTMTTTQGVIKFKFYPQDAPKTVHRFIELIQQGFYNNLAFHRVVPGFVIQGGDPQGNGTGGSGQKLDAEFNSRHHVEGTVAMARAQDPNSADSQFYICLGTIPHLDRNYTVFGQVVEGMAVVKAIKIGDKMTSVTIQ
jgi:peptidylprolyl isomerase/peptidyl-prolyl cis-trans isomerase B (cyclophilin B)